ncbi:methionine adenosyltransferase [Picrophilus oshimae]|uniref:S-adenosylmethionine synthase n=2 Tax=Picrophilus torridus (strain ATCC 700027 / DSM 9790 / JCM 10055 / NBRC 100828 / KAW 2/3) TaxID=1122961 RepID=METK_PICTO|nr:methionine adenosyltransferase [Picrophilus oshimae]Q6L123.2 RecName: Full=S-adenosylmethionine synthase; Short=AdoMet synthase; AltName: Full=Methionine adenosyltransferase [Picrophilus oshimae DSM 9789]
METLKTRNIQVEAIKQSPTASREVEIVERKGIGHPDSVADGIAEAVSRSLSKYYIKNYGRILHHNTDQVEVVGGQSDPRFGGGVVLEPSYILISGRATSTVNGERIPVKSIAIKAAKDYLREHFRDLEIDSDVMIDSRIGNGSIDLRGLYDTRKFKANDTSFGVGFAPFTDTETIVKATEKYINGDLKKSLPQIGYDIKVMGFRKNRTINLTVAAAYVDKYVKDPDEYYSVKEELVNKITDNALKYTNNDVQVFVNTGDIKDDKVYYLTVTGLSMENGDDGSVGRGNRVNGLITPYRPMSMEAAAGKNPVTHVGKLYNVLSNIIANDIVKEEGGDIKEVLVRIVSQIGRPVDEPHVASIQVIYEDNVDPSKHKNNITAIADDRIAHISDLTNMFVDGKLDVF